MSSSSALWSARTRTLFVLLILGTVLQAATPTLAATTPSVNSVNSSSAEERGFMDKAANAELAQGGLNLLTTSCNGACGANAPCVIVGSTAAPASRINCVNDTRCATLTNGKTALCMEPFASGADTWTFSPSKTNNTVGLSPFERVGLVQPSESVKTVLFRRAEDKFGPLPTAFDVSSLNLAPVSRLAFDSLTLTGLENALTVPAEEIDIVNCNLKTIPTTFVLGDNVRKLDLSRNALSSAREIRPAIFPSLERLNLQDNQLTSMDLMGATFPVLQSLQLDGNQLSKVPDFIFELGSLRNLTIQKNPALNASSLNATQFAFLAQLTTFSIEGVTPTRACPPIEVIRRLNGSFTFCIGQNDSSSSGSGGVSVADVVPVPSPTTNVANAAPTHHRSKTGLIVGIVVGAIALLLIIALLYRWCVRRRDRRRDEEPHKPTFTSVGSFIGGGGNMGIGKQHAAHSMMDDFLGDQNNGHYDAFVPLRSNASSEQSSDSYPILGNIASDGPDGLAKLEYEDLYFIKLLRVSSRSELWLGEYFGEDVVVKKIKTGTVSRAVMRDFVEEVKLMAALSHPRIVDFRGALWDKHGAELCAVVEHMEQGALRSVTNSTTASSTLTVPKQYAIARQVAEALAYLHDQQIVHGRLNAFNILLDHEFSAKLSVFAVFHYVRLSPLDYECAVFVAPEVQRGQQPTEKADVYAFGVVLVELAAGESPETNRRRRLSLQDSSPEANSPLARRTGFTLGAQCSSMMKDLITACLERDPARRPSMAQIAMALQTGEVVV